MMRVFMYGGVCLSGMLLGSGGTEIFMLQQSLKSICAFSEGRDTVKLGANNLPCGYGPGDRLRWFPLRCCTQTHVHTYCMEQNVKIWISKKKLAFDLFLHTGCPFLVSMATAQIALWGLFGQWQGWIIDGGSLTSLFSCIHGKSLTFSWMSLLSYLPRVK